MPTAKMAAVQMRVLPNSYAAPAGMRSTRGGGFVRNIEIGQRLKQTNAPRTAWVVLEAVLDPANIRHLRIRSLDDPTIVKLISEPTLANERLYRLIKEQ
jgi:hypothetical protein